MLRRVLLAGAATRRMAALRSCVAGADPLVVARQPGHASRDIPIWAAPGALVLGERDRAKRRDVRENVFVLESVLSDDECDAIVTISERMGYTEDAPVSLGRDIRRNENVVWIADDALVTTLFARCARFVPPEISLRLRGGGEVRIGPATGLNRRWRLYKYGVGDTFKWHTDGGWAGSGLDESNNLVDDLYDGRRHSWLTFLMYLNDDFDGGETSFRDPSGSVFAVTPVKGSVLCFFHGYHPLSPQHQSELITRGVKYVARTDILYEMPETLR